ncbi:MAG TPA: CDP-alcohol phosphatidyltransferase family protein [Solirubrobacteraceae bacterium]|nr:CDP-alcohol phosphatidyltransferase family protein [Solirubrobacteraceae bacterium]
MGEPPLISQRRLTFRRLFGLDRSGPPPPQTVAGAPLHPWTVPNLIVALRLAGIPVFLVLVYSTENGHSVAAALLYLALAVSDYVDGIAARVTGQYSRLGAIVDPFVDRLLVVAGMVACWSYELLPRWAIAILIARELFMLVLARYGMRHGVDLAINWPGRLGVWPVLGAPFWAIIGVHWLALAMLYVGLVLTLWSTALYIRDGRRRLALQRSSRA